ncbi:hypothetical protein [Nisaea sp.]|uniref:hypothetical protein n=1 Tax=Nisaea sp. TaxID=2024842 RepID=UPI0025F0FAF4|nr:hypothetical protein [Nisaea sp.]
MPTNVPVAAPGRGGCTSKFVVLSAGGCPLAMIGWPDASPAEGAIATCVGV